jgi:adenylate kinase
MRLILVGPPGSGKGTQAQLLCKRQNLSHIGTGDMIREAIRLKTPAGRRAEPFVLSGQLVPDDLINDMVADRFQREDRPERFLMDGYPRTVAQAASFDLVLRQQFLDISAVIHLAVPDEEIVHRLSGRWSCPTPNCKATYHTTYKPPRLAGLCDVCHARLIQRDDDREATVTERLKVYHANNVALLEYYRRQGLLREVQGTGDIEKIYADIVQAQSAAPRA